MGLPRLRQLVFASRDITDIERLKTVLGLGQEFVDPGVKAFGLTNGVFALGDQFLEVVVPTEEHTAAGRFIDRTKGIGGYMAIFQTDDLQAVRKRTDQLQIRRVWNVDLPDISASHLHPADIGAAIVSIDEARPAESWRWGGPDWQKNTRSGRLTRLDITASDPATLSQAWGQTLGLTPQALKHDIYLLSLQDGEILFAPGDRDFLSAYHLTHPEPATVLHRAQAQGLSADPSGFFFAGVRVTVSPD
ncbi:MAG: VOC family protein [Pseudomonadota bacterium]